MNSYAAHRIISRRNRPHSKFEALQAHDTNVFDDPELAPTYNAAPQAFQPVIRLNSETGEREIALVKWGLMPYWILLANSVT
jgi:putative SOS response-associated peptidase YedK